MPRKAKRAPKGSGHIRKRGDGRFEARYTIGVDPKTGKTLYRSIYGKTQEEVAKKLRKATVEVDEGVYTDPSKMTVAIWMDIWLGEYCNHLKETSVVNYEGRIKNWVKPGLGPVKLCALTAPAIQRFYNDLQRGDKPLAPPSVKGIHNMLHKALQQAVELKYIQHNPTDGCKLPRCEKPKIIPMDDDAIAQFMDAIRGRVYERMLIVDLFSGLRQAELVGLTWDCIDFERGTIHVYRQYRPTRGVYKFTTIKNDKPRTITPAQFVMDTLKEQRRAQAEWRLKAGAAWIDGDFVFTNRIGEHIKARTLYGNFKNTVKRIGIPEARFHDLRHTYAVASIRSGDDIKTLQENLGHHSVAFTLDVYGHVTEQMKRESAARMDAFISGLKHR